MLAALFIGGKIGSWFLEGPLGKLGIGKMEAGRPDNTFFLLLLIML
jgi:hypothetical protein